MTHLLSDTAGLWGVFFAVFFLMEGVAWATHKYVMHGFLWSLHASHHQPRTGVFEKNDWFGVFFSLIAIALVFAGMTEDRVFLAAGLGMTAYGIAYLFLHDALAHKRFGIRIKPGSGYLRAVLRSHRLHHAHREKRGAVSFGFLVPRPAPARKRPGGRDRP